VSSTAAEPCHSSRGSATPFAANSTMQRAPDGAWNILPRWVERRRSHQTFCLFRHELVEFGHCSNPLFVGGTTPVRHWSFPRTRNSQLEIKVPTRRHESRKDQWKRGLVPSSPCCTRSRPNLFSEASILAVVHGDDAITYRSTNLAAR
jgi:hypothetical protein